MSAQGTNHAGKTHCVLWAALRHLLCKSRLRFLPLYTATVVRCVVSPAATALMLFPRGRASTREAGDPTSDAPRYLQLRCVWPKCWQRLHCSRPFGATYYSIDIRKPQSSVSDRTLDTSGPRATDMMKWGVGGRSLPGSWSRRPERS